MAGLAGFWKPGGERRQAGAQLEDQMCAFTNDFDRKRAGYSPDRVDALVWSLSQMIVEPMPGEGLLQWYEQQARAAGTLGMMPGEYGADAPLQPTADQLPKVPMRAPPNWCGTVHGTNGKDYAPLAGAILEVQPDDVVPLRRLGFTDATAAATEEV